MVRKADAGAGRPGRRRRIGRAAPAALLMLVILGLGGCTPPAAAPASTPAQGVAAPAAIPDQCRGDGAVQTWLLLPQVGGARPSELLAAYQDRQVIEFHATVVGRDDSPALQPHRRFLLREAAEGIPLWLDYQGDPPPLIQGQSYRFIAWADLTPAPPTPGASTTPADPRSLIPASRGYELQIYDSVGLLFLGRTDVDEQDDALGLQLIDGAGACPAVPASPAQSACMQSRTTLPLVVRWGEDELSLLPGEDGLLSHRGATYSVALFRNRALAYADPPCPDYHEHRRSLRIDRVDPLPMAPAPQPVTGTITGTLPAITATVPFTLPPPPDVPLP